MAMTSATIVTLYDDAAKTKAFAPRTKVSAISNDSGTGLQNLLDAKFNNTGGNISGHIYLTGANASSSTGNTSQLVFGTPSSNHVALSSNNNALVLNPTISSTTNQIVLYLDSPSVFPSGIRVGSANFTYDSTKKAVKISFI